MRIVIDLQGNQTESRFRGIGRYSLALALALARNPRGHELRLVLNGVLAESLESIRQAFSGLIAPECMHCFEVPVSIAGKDPANNWRARAAEQLREEFIAALRPDIVLVSSLFEGWNDAAAVSVPEKHPDYSTAIVFYDLIPLLHPETYLNGDVIRAWYSRKIDSLRRADLLLSISDYARREAMDTLGLSGEGIVNISSAAGEFFRPAPLAGEALNRLLAHYGLDRPFIMYNGAFESRKNLPRLLQAFAQLPGPVRDSHCLLLAGMASSESRSLLMCQADSLGIRPQLRLAGYIPDQDLLSFYSHCALFVFPSLHEGFGLPALEAMSCGAPVIGSNTTSIPEVIGLPGALFDPKEPADMARKMEEALTDGDFNRSLREHGLRQATCFSWESSASRTLEAIEAFTGFQSAGIAPSWPQQRRLNRAQYQKLIQSLADLPGDPQDIDLVNVAHAIHVNQMKVESLQRAADLPSAISWRIEGPFDSSYSLALLNRETVRALADFGHTVILHSTEGPGDFAPNPDFLRAHPDLAAMHARSFTTPAEECAVASRNLYPPRVDDMTAPLNLLHHYAWEESGFPREWVDSFNENLQGVTCLSRHVEKILIDHGVTVPLATSGCGVDHWLRIEAESSFHLEARAFRFLHVSSCFPRKGVDVLLQAYGAAFTDADDVSLVIKTFANPHNQLNEQINRLRRERADYPHLLVIEDDKMSDAALKALYQQCHCLVAPSRAEGFGLPLAEAMLSGLAVITTGWGGQMDFCSADTAWLIDYTFTPAATHFHLYESVWAEPNLAHLAATMKEIRNLPVEQRQERSARARGLLLDHFRWRDCARRLEKAARSWARMPAAPLLRTGWVTTWNCRCGIAAYSAHLLRHFPAPVKILAARTKERIAVDEPEVIRCWAINGHSDQGDDLGELGRAIAASALDTLVVQFNYGFFHIDRLARFLDEQLDAGRCLVLILHSTVDRDGLPQGRLAPLVPALARCDRICVHAVADLNRLKDLGLINNVTLFPHAIPDYLPSSAAAPVKMDTSPVIASYGFFLPHKGLLELIEALAILVGKGEDVRLLMVNASYSEQHSGALIDQARRRIAELGLSGRVRVVSRYLPDEESLALLQEADLIVFPYQQTGESSSAAARFGLAAGRPVAVTPLPIFDDLGQAVWRLPGVKPEEIASGILERLRQLSLDSKAATDICAEADRWRRSHRYVNVSRRLYGLLTALGREVKGTR